MPTVLLVRHGQASFGAADYDVLSDLGRRQAQAAGRELARRLGVPAQLVKFENPVAVIEAMKMENEITAHRSGKIEELGVKEGAAVSNGDTIVVIK